MHSIPPRITEKSCRLRVSNRTMVGVLEPPRVACVASGPKASNHQVMKPASRNCRLPWSVRSTSRIQSLSRSQIGLDANHHIHRLSERTEGKSFLDIPSHRTHRQLVKRWLTGEVVVGRSRGAETALLHPSDSLRAGGRADPGADPSSAKRIRVSFAADNSVLRAPSQVRQATTASTMLAADAVGTTRVMRSPAFASSAPYSSSVRSSPPATVSITMSRIFPG